MKTYQYLALVGLLLVGGRAAGAQSDSAFVYAGMQRQEARIRSCDVTWKFVNRTPGDPKIDVQQEVDKMLALDRTRQVDPAQIELDRTHNFPTLVKEEREGSTTTELLHFESRNGRVWCSDRIRRSAGTPVEMWDASFADNSAGIEGCASAWVGGETGTCTLHAGAVLWRLGPGPDPRWFLIGKPLTGQYPPRGASVIARGPGTVTLDFHDQSIQYSPNETRLVVSTATWRPLLRRLDGRNGYVPSVTTFSGYKQYPGGIWFPSHISARFPMSTEDWYLVHAAFNGNARLHSLKRWIPIGTEVSDERLEQTVTYRYHGLLPSHGRLRALLRQQAVAVAPSGDSLLRGRAPRVPHSEIATFSRAMGESMSAGHHLVACLHEAEARTSGLYFRKVIGQVIHGIESGYPLSTSMAKCPDVFDRSYVRAVWHGEVTANLDWAMLDLGAVKPGAPGGPSSQQSRTRRMTGP